MWIQEAIRPQYLKYFIQILCNILRSTSDYNQKFLRQMEFLHCRFIHNIPDKIESKWNKWTLAIGSLTIKLDNLLQNFPIIDQDHVERISIIGCAAVQLIQNIECKSCQNRVIA